VGLIAVVSSQVNQVRQGVGPPAQLRIVPDRLAALSTNSPASGSKTRLEVPPLASGSYAGSVNLPEKLPCSWLRTSRTRSSIRKAAIPSCAPGVASPSDIASPRHE
jgi:hypothetical protein